MSRMSVARNVIGFLDWKESTTTREQPVLQVSQHPHQRYKSQIPNALARASTTCLRLRPRHASSRGPIPTPVFSADSSRRPGVAHRAKLTLERITAV